MEKAENSGKAEMNEQQRSRTRRSDRGRQDSLYKGRVVTHGWATSHLLRTIDSSGTSHNNNRTKKSLFFSLFFLLLFFFHLSFTSFVIHHSSFIIQHQSHTHAHIHNPTGPNHSPTTSTSNSNSLETSVLVVLTTNHLLLLQPPVIKDHFKEGAEEDTSSSIFSNHPSFLKPTLAK